MESKTQPITFRRLFDDQPEEPAAEISQPAQDSDDEGLGWLEQLGEDPGTDLGAESDDLSDIFGEISSTPEEPQAIPEPVLESEDDPSLDWLTSMSSEAEAESEPHEEGVPITSPLGDIAKFTAPDKDLAALFNDPTSGTPSPPAEDSPPADDWPQHFGVSPGTEELPTIVPPAALDSLFPDEFSPSEEPPEQLEAEQVDDSTGMDWLSSIAGEKPEPIEGIDTVHDGPTLEVPPDYNDAVLSLEDQPGEIIEDQPVQPPPPSELDESMAWLDGLAADQDAPEEQATPAEESATDWLEEIDKDDHQEGEPTLADDLDELDAFLDEVEELSASQPATQGEVVFEDDNDFSMDWLTSIGEEAAVEAGAVELTAPDQEEQVDDDLANLFGEVPAVTTPPAISPCRSKP